MMKFFVVFGVLFACACALTFPFEDRFSHVRFDAPRDKSSEVVMFSPTALPCEFSLEVDAFMQSIHTNQSGVYVENSSSVTVTSMYGFMLHTLQKVVDETGESSVTTTLVRPDLTENKAGVLSAPKFVNDGSTCSKELLSIDEIEKNGMNQRIELAHTEYFMGQNFTSFNGVDCWLYYNETNTSSFYVYVDSNDRYIIAQFASFSLGVNTTVQITANYSYDFAPSRGLFTMNKTENPGCDDAAYVVPKKFECVGAVHTPGDIPCPISVNEFRVLFSQGFPVDFSATLFMYDDLLCATWDMKSQIYYRADLKNENGIPVFTHNVGSLDCSQKYVSESDVRNVIQERFSFVQKRKFHSVSESYGDLVFKTRNETFEETLTVSSADNMIKSYSTGNATDSLTITYTWADNIVLDSFILNRTEAPKCNNASAFTVPKALYPCGVPSSSSSVTPPKSSVSELSSAPLNVVSVAVILAMVVFCLF